MRKKISILVAAFFYYSGLVALFRWWMRQRFYKERCVLILNYHRASRGDLQSHLLYLRRHYRMLHLEDALVELYTPTPRQSSRDRRTALVLTFDDGYADNYTHAFPLAQKLQVPITIFVIPGYIESGEAFWWEEGKRLLGRTPRMKILFEGQNYSLQDEEERDELLARIEQRLRFATSVGEREAFLTRVRKQLVVPATLTATDDEYRPLTWAQVYKMAASGWVSFGAHTQHHPILGYLRRREEVYDELVRCRKMLEERLHYPVRTLAYPVGKSEHIGAEAILAARKAGYIWAVTTRKGINTPVSDPYQLARFSSGVERHWLIMAAEICGLWSLFAPFWKLFVSGDG